MATQITHFITRVALSFPGFCNERKSKDKTSYFSTKFKKNASLWTDEIFLKP